MNRNTNEFKLGILDFISYIYTLHVFQTSWKDKYMKQKLKTPNSNSNSFADQLILEYLSIYLSI